MRIFYYSFPHVWHIVKIRYLLKEWRDEWILSSFLLSACKYFLFPCLLLFGCSWMSGMSNYKEHILKCALSSLADLVGSSGVKIGFLEDAWKKSTFPQFGREILFWLFFSSSSFFFFFLTCPLLFLSCHISKHWTLTYMSTSLLPLTSSLSVTCELWGEVIRWAVGHSDQQP